MRAGWTVLVAAATVLAGCQAVQDASLAAWEPDDCDPGQVTKRNQMAPLTSAWQGPPEAVAAQYAELMGHGLGDHEQRPAPGNGTIHEWQVLDSDGGPSGRLSLRPVPLVMGGSATGWRLESEAGIPDIDVAAAEELVARLLADFGAEDVDVEGHEAMGLLQVQGDQTFAGQPVADPYGGRPHVEAFRHHAGTTLLTMRPVHDLSAARATLGADAARSIADRYWECGSGQGVEAGRVQWTAVHGALSYAVALRTGDPPFGCEGAIVVDAVTGAVFGQSIDSVCA